MPPRWRAVRNGGHRCRRWQHSGTRRVSLPALQSLRPQAKIIETPTLRNFVVIGGGPGGYVAAIRIAQLAKLITQQQSFFSLFTQTNSIEDLRNALKIEQSVYWQEHYSFGKTANKKLVGLGKDSINNILINTVIPLLACYSEKTDNQEFMTRCVSFLEALPAEKNHITEMWEGLGLTIKSAFDSQASIELYNNFCTQKRCLQCNVGIEILKK